MTLGTPRGGRHWRLPGIPPATTMFFSGIGTLQFLVITKGRVPGYLGSSFAFIAPIMASQQQYGVGATLVTPVTIIVVNVLFRRAHQSAPTGRRSDAIDMTFAISFRLCIMAANFDLRRGLKIHENTKFPNANRRFRNRLYIQQQPHAWRLSEAGHPRQSAPAPVHRNLQANYDDPSCSCYSVPNGNRNPYWLILFSRYLASPFGGLCPAAKTSSSPIVRMLYGRIAPYDPPCVPSTKRSTIRILKGGEQMIATKINAKSGTAPMRGAALTAAAAQPVMTTPLAVAAGVTATAAIFAAGVAVGATVK